VVSVVLILAAHLAVWCFTWKHDDVGVIRQLIPSWVDNGIFKALVYSSRYS
jgi:hypothetical protein